MPEPDSATPDVPFTADPPGTHCLIITERERAVIARALSISLTLSEAVDRHDDVVLLRELKERFS